MRLQHAKLDGGAFAGLGRVIGARAAACARRDRPGHVHTRGAYRAPTRHTRGRGPAAGGWVKVLDHNFGLGLEVLHACSPGLGPGAGGRCGAGGEGVLTVLLWCRAVPVVPEVDGLRRVTRWRESRKSVATLYC